MPQRNRLLTLLKQFSYQPGDVVLSSGARSDYYFDGKQTSLHPEGLLLLSDMLLDEAERICPEVAGVCGPTLGADPLIAGMVLISQQRGTPLVGLIIRKEPKSHGTCQWIEGARHIRLGMPVVMVEDVVTSGAASLKAIHRARQAGLNVRALLCIVDREAGGRKIIEAQRVKFVSLFSGREIRGA